MNYIFIAIEIGHSFSDSFIYINWGDQTHPMTNESILLVSTLLIFNLILNKMIKEQIKNKFEPNNNDVNSQTLSA